MKNLLIRTDFTARTFAPFGAVIERPSRVGDRQFFSDWLGSSNPICQPVFHTNLIKASSPPYPIARLEKHPHAAQAFVPLDVARYCVVVAPSDRAGRPRVDAMEAFVVPGSLGIIYRANVWHAGAATLDRDGCFSVLMWRGAPDDDVFTEIEPVLLVELKPGLREAGQDG